MVCEWEDVAGCGRESSSCIGLTKGKLFVLPRADNDWAPGFRRGGGVTMSYI